MDVIADDAHKGSTDGDQPDLLALEIFNWETTNPYVDGKWLALFAGVNRANGVLDLINKSDNPSEFQNSSCASKILERTF